MLTPLGRDVMTKRVEDYDIDPPTPMNWRRRGWRSAAL